MTKRRHTRYPAAPSPLLMALMCDGEHPADRAYQQKELLAAYSALDAVTRDQAPEPAHWRALAHVVEMARALERLAALPPEAHADINGAIGGLAVAGARAQDEGKPIRIPGPYLMHVNGLLEWYEAALRDLPERTVVAAAIAVAKQNAALHRGQTRGRKVVRL